MKPPVRYLHHAHLSRSGLIFSSSIFLSFLHHLSISPPSLINSPYIIKLLPLHLISMYITHYWDPYPRMTSLQQILCLISPVHYSLLGPISQDDVALLVLSPVPLTYLRCCSLVAYTLDLTFWVYTALELVFKLLAFESSKALLVFVLRGLTSLSHSLYQSVGHRVNLLITKLSS